MATIFTGIMPAKVDGTPAKRGGRKTPSARAGKRTPLHRDVTGREAAGLSFEADAAAVLRPLQAALAAVLDSLPGRLERSTDLQHLLKTDPKLAWQVYKFVKAPAVLPASSALPGAVAMRRFHKLAARKGVDKPLTDASLSAFDAFERFVKDRAGDRRSFNTMAGGGRNDGHATNLAHKKAAFRAAAHFLGVQTDVVAITFLLHPSNETPGDWDLATLVYKVGIRRLRPDARVMLASVGTSDGQAEGGGANRFEPIEPDVDPGFVATLLPPFCSNASADTVITRGRHGTVEMEIAAGSIGTAGATDWAFGTVERHCTVAAGPGEHIGLKADISAAVQTLIVDLLVARPDGPEPSSKVMTYVSSGHSERRDYERLSLSEAVVAMGRGDVAAQRSEIPRYNDLIRYACGRLGWELSRFRAYRCRVEYPVLGSSLDLHFDYPGTPESP